MRRPAFLVSPRHLPLLSLLLSLSGHAGCSSDDGQPADDGTTGEMPASTGASTSTTDPATSDPSTSDASTGHASGDTTGAATEGDESGSTGSEGILRDVYDLEGQTLYPEGVAWDPETRSFFVGSLGDGSLHRVDVGNDGKQSMFAAAPAGAWSTSGIAVDAENRRLWACTSQTEPEKVQAVWVLDLETAEIVETFDLGEIDEGADCNDLTVGPDGSAYVTDPPLGVVHRLELGGTAEIWATSPSFTPDVPGLGLNGITVTPDASALIVAKYVPPTLFRIELDDPTAITKIVLGGDLFQGGTAIAGADGIVFVGDALFVVFDDVVKRVDFDDPGMTMGTVSTLEPPSDGLSTAAEAEGELYVVKSEVTAFVLGEPPDLPFQILRVPTR